MTLAELLELLARWADLDDADRTRLNEAVPAFVAECNDQDELDQLDTALQAVADEILDGEGSPDDDGLEVLQWIAPTVAAVRARGAELEGAEAEREAEATRLAEQIRGSQSDGDEGEGAEGEGTEGEGDGDAGTEGEGGDAEGAATEGADGEQVAEPVAAAAGAAPARIVPRRPNRAARRARPDLNVAPITAAANVPGLGAGQRLDGLTGMGQAVMAMVDAFRTGGMPGPRLAIPAVTQLADLSQIPADRILTRDAQENDRKILAQQSPQAIAAAGGFCASFPVTYDVPGVGVADRPVKDALLQFMADRGGVRLQEPATLEELEGSTTIWTGDNDANPGSDGPSEKPVLVVECGDEREFEVYGIPQALEFKNFSSRNHPERQAKIVELAAVHAARVAETRLLTDIGAGSTQVTVGEGLSATRDILTGIDRIVASRRSFYRLGMSMPLRRIAPMWERDLIRADLARELPGSTAERLAVADAQIDEFFRVRNINNTYVLDGESGQVFGEQGNGPALGWPGSIVSYLFPEGTWLYLNGGEFNLGVVRDTAMARLNKFQLWSEIVEGTAMQGVWSLRVTHDVCPSGATSGTVDFDPCAFGS